MIRDIIVSIIRQLLTSLFGGAAGWLVAHGAVSNGQIELLFAVLAGVVVNIVWSVGERMVRRWHLDVALALPANSDINRLNVISAATPLGVKIREAITGPIPADPDATPRQ
jgi:hypothetical protein